MLNPVRFRFQCFILFLDIFLSPFALISNIGKYSIFLSRQLCIYHLLHYLLQPQSDQSLLKFTWLWRMHVQCRSHLTVSLRISFSTMYAFEINCLELFNTKCLNSQLTILTLEDLLKKQDNSETAVLAFSFCLSVRYSILLKCSMIAVLTRSTFYKLCFYS